MAVVLHEIDRNDWYSQATTLVRPFGSLEWKLFQPTAIIHAVAHLHADGMLGAHKRRRGAASRNDYVLPILFAGYLAF